MRTFEDLVFLTQLKDEIILYVRPFADFESRYEWRVFVKDKKVIGISQQFYKETFSYNKKYLNEIERSVTYFMYNICIPNIKVDNFVADLYVSGGTHYKPGIYKKFLDTSIIETNPYGFSDPCLFGTYDELESSKELLKYNK